MRPNQTPLTGDGQTSPDPAERTEKRHQASIQMWLIRVANPVCDLNTHLFHRNASSISRSKPLLKRHEIQFADEVGERRHSCKEVMHNLARLRYLVPHFFQGNILDIAGCHFADKVICGLACVAQEHRQVIPMDVANSRSTSNFVASLRSSVTPRERSLALAQSRPFHTDPNRGDLAHFASTPSDTTSAISCARECGVLIKNYLNEHLLCPLRVIVASPSRKNDCGPHSRGGGLCGLRPCSTERSQTAHNDPGHLRSRPMQ